MKFDEIREFFISWGLSPSDEDLTFTGLGNADGECIINSSCYSKLLDEAEMKFGLKFMNFCSTQIDSTDGEFYLVAEKWDEVASDWINVGSPGE